MTRERYERSCQASGQRGLSLIEVLVGMTILSVVGLAVAMNTINSYVFLKHSERNSYAAQLALDKLEMLAARNPSTITSADNATENGLVRNHVTFNRTTTVALNADGSRTVTVQVLGTKRGGKSTLQNTFMPWGNS